MAIFDVKKDVFWFQKW